MAWMSRRSRLRVGQLAVLGAVFVLSLALLLLATARVTQVPASTADYCSSNHLARQADPEHLALYFNPRPQPITEVVSHFLMQPHPRTCNTRLDLLILVPSSPEDASRREDIRTTWGSVTTKGWPGSGAKRKVGLVFLLGRRGHGGMAVVQEEAIIKGDLLVGDFVDSYRNLTRKMLAGLNWVSRHCSHHPTFVLKADQDTFVNVGLLLDILFNLQGDEPMVKTMLGELLCSEHVRREPDSRVFVNSSVYPFPVYPPYVRGGSYVLTGELVTHLVNASQHMPFVPVEDAFINGVVARTLHVQHIHLPGVMKGLACPLSPCLFFGTRQISATGVEPYMMQAIWQQLEAGSEQCHKEASWWTHVCVWISNRLK